MLALLVGLGLHTLTGDTIKKSAEILASHLHLDPTNELSSIIIHTAKDLNNTRLLLISIAAIIYSLIRFIEAYGLWHRYRWTEWFALLSGSIYLPYEFFKFVTTNNLLNAAILLINLIIVIYMGNTLKKHS